MTPPWRPGARWKQSTASTQPQASKTAKSLRPYRAVSSLERMDSTAENVPLKLDWNESTLPPSPLVAQRIQEFMSQSDHLNWYPDQKAAVLTERLAGYTGLPMKNILVTSGSDAALDVLCQTYLDPSDEVVVPSPTYTHFLVYAGARGARVRQVYNVDPFELDIDTVLDALSYRTKIVYLVSPCNPTGVVWPAAVVARIARSAPNAIIIVDEAYFEYLSTSSAAVAPQKKK